MKKLSKILLIGCISLLLAFGLTACKDEECEHIYDNNCDAICNVCGEERAAQAHQWKEPDCTSPKTCKDCGLTEGEALGHTTVYHEGEEPTCTENGSKDYWYCVECETKFSDEEGTHKTTDKEMIISSTGHSLTHHELVEESCNEYGILEHWTCDNCVSRFTDEEGTQPIGYEDLITPKKIHIDENADHMCDHGCGEILLETEKLQQIIENTLSSTKVTVKETYIPGDRNTSYYFDEILLYLNCDINGEKYYYTEDATTYLLTNSNGWSKEMTTEVVKYNISYLFENKFNLTIASELSVYNCTYGFFDGKTMFQYTNSLGTYIRVKLNDDGTLLEGIYICDENNNITHMYEMVYGENDDIINEFDIILNGFEVDAN